MINLASVTNLKVKTDCEAVSMTAVGSVSFVSRSHSRAAVSSSVNGSPATTFIVDAFMSCNCIWPSLVNETVLSLSQIGIVSSQTLHWLRRRSFHMHLQGEASRYPVSLRGLAQLAEGPVEVVFADVVGPGAVEQPLGQRAWQRSTPEPIRSIQSAPIQLSGMRRNCLEIPGSDALELTWAAGCSGHNPSTPRTPAQCALRSWIRPGRSLPNRTGSGSARCGFPGPRAWE